jgi:hypothetical protein
MELNADRTGQLGLCQTNAGRTPGFRSKSVVDRTKDRVDEEFAILGQFLGFGIVVRFGGVRAERREVSNTATEKGVTEIIHAAFLGVFPIGFS